MNSSNTTKDEESKQLKSIFCFINLKSDYFLKKMFDNMKRNKSLEIVKYNKKLDLLIYMMMKRNIIIFILIIQKKK